MGFVNANGYPLINEEHKVRIALSVNARIKMAEDMTVFRVEKATTFINTVFDNYKNEAKASISLYPHQHRLALEELFSKSEMDDCSREAAIDFLMAEEDKIAREKAAALISSKSEGKLYHINNKNVQFLTEDCEEEEYYSRPGLYIRAVIEEYCTLPFIERERIYRKDVYETIAHVRDTNKILKIKVRQYDKVRNFYVYPYKILPDPLQTQSYLTCYTTEAGSEGSGKTIASFAMARLNLSTVLDKTFHLTKKEKDAIQEQIEKNYQSRLSNRPEKIAVIDDIYIFDCTQRQVFNFFFSFGSEAEILSPESLREQFRSTSSDALGLYTGLKQ